MLTIPWSVRARGHLGVTSRVLRLVRETTSLIAYVAALLRGGSRGGHLNFT
jgi:hypothetical protein